MNNSVNCTVQNTKSAPEVEAVSPVPGDSEFVLFSTGCPKCVVLQQMLHSIRLKYEINHDVDILMDQGFQTIPVLYRRSKNKFMNFSDAVKFVNSLQ